MNTNTSLISINNYRIWLMALFLTMYSCEYESDNEYYKNIDKPSEIYVGLDLAGVGTNEPIYIYENTKLYYSLNAEGRRVLSLEASINGGSIQSFNDSFFMIDKNSLKKDEDNILSIKIRLNSGSGSLADIMGAEYYEGDFIYILKVVDNDIQLNIRETQTEDGYLKLEWDALELPQLNIASYEIIFTDSRGVVRTITQDGTTTSFVDKNYVYGYRAYHITMKFADNKISDKTTIYNMSYTPITSDDITISFKDLEETKISWKDNKYRCQYYIQYNRNVQVVASTSYGSTEVYLSAPAFPKETGFYTILILPDDMKPNEITHSTKGIEKFFQYEAAPSPLRMAVMTWDITSNLLYGRTGTTVQLGNAITLGTVKSINSPYFQNLSDVSISPKSNKFLVFNGYNYSITDNIIYVFNDKNNLTNTTPIKINSPKRESRYGRVYLIDDDRIFIESSFYDNSNMKEDNILIDINTGEILYNLETNPFTNSLDISSDRERLAVYDKSMGQLQIYKIDIGKLSLSQTITLSNKSDGFCIFNPNNSNQVIIASWIQNFFTIIDISTTKTHILEGSFITIDPFTGRIYCYNKNYNINSLIDVYEKDSWDSPIFQFKANKDGSLNVYNDFVISYRSYIKISKYIK